jgi:ABC-type nitrate/sulfonate/bicarbonate transport system substrate-binding protein
MTGMVPWSVTDSTRRSSGLVALAVLVAALLACTPTSGTVASTPPASPASSNGQTVPQGAEPAPARSPRTLQVAVQGLAGFFYPMWVAQRQGLLRDVGLTVEWSTLDTNQAIPALLGGSLDILNASTDAALIALSKGAALRLVGDYNITTPYELVARPEIATLDALRGQKVGASSLNAGSGTIVRYMLRARGLGDDDYELVQAGGNPQRYTALQSGGVAASILTDPVNFRARLDGYRILAAFADLVPEYSLDSWWVRADWLNDADNREALVGFLTALGRAQQWAKAPENHQALVDLIMDEAHSPREVAEQIYDYYVVQNPGAIDSTDVREGPVGNVIRILRELQDLPLLPPEASWIDRTYAQRARDAVAQPAPASR